MGKGTAFTWISLSTPKSASLCTHRQLSAVLAAESSEGPLSIAKTHLKKVKKHKNKLKSNLTYSNVFVKTNKCCFHLSLTYPAYYH